MLLAPWFLVGLLAIGIPLWLHRIARSERIKVPFASVMLLEASEVRDTSRRNLRYWLLLAIRIALLIALVLAFAQPLLKLDNAALTSKESKLHAIVLDTSLSMQYDNRWQRAVEQAQKLIDELKRGDHALLVAASGRKIELVAGPVIIGAGLSGDASSLHAALATLKPSLERLDYGMLMSSSTAWLSADGLPTQLHLITDLQQSASPLRFADLAPPVNAQIEIYDVSASPGKPASNLAVGNISVQGSGERELIVTLRGDMPTQTANQSQRELVLTIDDQKIQTKRVLPDATNAVAQISFAGIKLRPGNHRLRLDLQPNDALPQDDTFFAVIEHSEPTVLLIAHDPDADEAAYLAAAIESQSAMRLTVVRATPQTLAKTLGVRPLSDYSAVFVTDSGILSAPFAQQLARYVEAGGAVFATLGVQAAQMKIEPITGIALRKTTDKELQIGGVDDSHPVLREASGWRAVRFMKHIDVEMGEQDRALITLGDQSPLLIERNGSAGRLLILTAPLDRAWNDLAIHPLFVRFIADCARYLTARDASAMAYSIGSRIATGIAPGTGGQIFDPQGGRVLALDDVSDASHLTPTQPGFYEVRSGQEKHWLAINPDARESDLRPMDADSVARWQTLRSDAAVPIAPAATEKEQVAAKSNIDRPIGWHLLLIAAVLLLAELLLGNYRLTIRRDGTRSGFPAKGAATVTSTAEVS
jgi:hypothetical protein